MNIITHLTDVVKGKHSLTGKRSNHWPTVRKQHLLKQPVCALCGGKSTLEVHHIRPFHLHPELELDPDNLITLCEDKKEGINCHLFFGHLGNYRSFNTSVIQDSSLWNNKVKNRPSHE